MIVVGGGSIAHPFVSTPSSIPPQGVPLNLMHLVWKTEHGETRYDDLDDFTRKLANGRARSGGGGGGGGGEGRLGRRRLRGGVAPRDPRPPAHPQLPLDRRGPPTAGQVHEKLVSAAGKREENSGLSRWSLLGRRFEDGAGLRLWVWRGSEHARDYALNHSDQFASPLFCDRGHPQDVEAWRWSRGRASSSSRSTRRSEEAEWQKRRGRGEGGGERRRRRRRRSVLAARMSRSGSSSGSSRSSSASGAPRIDPPPANRPAAPAAPRLRRRHDLAHPGRRLPRLDLQPARRRPASLPGHSGACSCGGARR